MLPSEKPWYKQQRTMS